MVSALRPGSEPLPLSGNIMRDELQMILRGRGERNHKSIRGSKSCVHRAHGRQPEFSCRHNLLFSYRSFLFFPSYSSTNIETPNSASSQGQAGRGAGRGVGWSVRPSVQSPDTGSPGSIAIVHQPLQTCQVPRTDRISTEKQQGLHRP